MEPYPSPVDWAASSSVGIDEETLKELLELDTFSSKPFVFSEPLDDSFLDAYKQELQGRRENVVPGSHHAEQMEVGDGGNWLQYHPMMEAPNLMSQPFDSGQALLPLEHGIQHGMDPDSSVTFPLGNEPQSRDGRKKRNRTPQQQELNKRAQQRYRERRKEKQSSLEAEVSSLKEQLAALRQLEVRNTELVRRNKFLEKLVKMQQEEVSLLKSQLLLPVKATESGASSDTRTRVSTPDELRKELETHVRALMQFLHANEIEQADQHVSNSSKHLIAKIVEAVCEVTVKLTVSSQSKVEDVIDKSFQSTHKVHHLDSLKPCVEKMKLTSDQVTAILHMRTDHLTRMLSVYKKRQELNMKAMSLMLPHPMHEKGGQFDPTVEGKLNCMGKSGFRDCNKNDELLTAVLDEIKQNVQKELRSYFELQVAMLQSILSPVQASMFIVFCHPDLVDALAFVNTLAVLHNDKSMELEMSQGHDA